MSGDSYMKLPYDLSGAMAKNRFKNEILWGMHKILEIYTNEKDFNVVFDYVCDIEVHWEDEKYEFYQIKTSNSGEAYTQNKLTKVGKKENSVFAKIYILKNEFDGKKENIKLAVVSNKPFKDKNNKLYNNIEILNFNSLDDDVKDRIKDDIKQELNIDNVDFDNINFIYTTIDLINPKNTLTGEIVNFFKDTLGVEIKKTTVLYNVLVDIIMQKAEYEMKSNTYDELIKNKAIKKGKIKQIFQKHLEISNNAVEKSQEIIENLYKDSYGKKIKMKVALSSIVSKFDISKKLQKLEQDIMKFINDNIEILNDSFYNVVCKLNERYQSYFDIEYSNEEIEAFIILILMKREEEIYD